MQKVTTESIQMNEKLKVKIIPLWASVLSALESLNWGLIVWGRNNILEFLFSILKFLLKAIYIKIGIFGIHLRVTIRHTLLFN